MSVSATCWAFSAGTAIIAILMPFSAMTFGISSDRMNDETANALVDFFRRAVEYKGDMEATLGEALIARDRAAEIARADQRNLPFTLDLEHLAKLVFQESDLVACSLLAETTEMRQVFADLRRTDSQAFAQFVRRRDLLAFLGQPFERTEVYRQTAYDNVWNCRRHNARFSLQPK